MNLALLEALEAQGQSLWLDFIRRDLVLSGALHRRVLQEGLKGVTSNPAIFEKAIAGSSDYAPQLARHDRSRREQTVAIYEELAVRDIQDAADVLLPVYQNTKARDGYVSLEVSPFLAKDSQGTLAEARRLWRAVGRANVMIKVPATPEGVEVFEQLIAEGLNVNVTLLFSVAQYETVAQAYMRGLETRAARGQALGAVASVASFFVSRIDSAGDALLLAQAKANPARAAQCESLCGKLAIANAKLAYARWQELMASPRWKALAAQGAQSQRLLWASTGTKNPKYSEVLYVEELIGAQTVNTVPPATLQAFLDKGKVRASLTEDLAGARQVVAACAAAGIELEALGARLLEEGLLLFSDAFEKLLDAVSGKQPDNSPRLGQLSLSSEQQRVIDLARGQWRAAGKLRRLWARDARLWTGADEDRWLGWLNAPALAGAAQKELEAFQSQVHAQNFRHVLLMGMGGSSLAPEVQARILGRRPGYPELVVLDSTDPRQVRETLQSVDPAQTLFLVASKSGSTLEPALFEHAAFEYVAEKLGRAQAGRRFVAITDPGSKLEELARKKGFWRIFHGEPTIGGRFSALSNFGLVPLAATGVDLARWIAAGQRMANACAPGIKLEQHPGVELGLFLGCLGRGGRDKLTLIVSPRFAALGAWLEQLIAESTGKHGLGLIPVDLEPLGELGDYGADRQFVYTRDKRAPDAAQEALVAELERAGHPLLRLEVEEPEQLAEEFFRWEFATAVAGVELGIHPFDQPDVEASKLETRKLTQEVESKGSLPEEQPFFRAEGVELYSDAANSQALLGAVGQEVTLARLLRAHLERAGAGDYVALLAYLPMNAANQSQLAALRQRVFRQRKVATCVGFGPRFLHSTGQAYKGGPNSGVVVQLTTADAQDYAVPGQRASFGQIKAAQARGDFQVLVDRKRRALRVHLASDTAAGLNALQRALEAAYSSAPLAGARRG